MYTGQTRFLDIHTIARLLSGFLEWDHFKWGTRIFCRFLIIKASVEEERLRDIINYVAIINLSEWTEVQDIFIKNEAKGVVFRYKSLIIWYLELEVSGCEDVVI